MYTKEEKYLREKSRNYSIKEGFFSTIKDSIINNYINPFAIAINSSNSLIAMISSLQGLLSPLTEIFSSKLIEKNPRKKIILNSVYFEILSFVLLILIAILYYFNILRDFLPFFLIFSFSFYLISFSVGIPAWFSWIGDLVDDRYRGRWFAKRNFVFNILALLVSVTSAVLLYFFKKINLLMFGFVLLFFIAMFSRRISMYYLNKQYEPELKIEKKYYFRFSDFVKKMLFNNFGRFTLFRALFSLSVMIAGPFFVVYMLRDLNFDYITFSIIVGSQTFFSIISLRLWGKFSDRYGNYEVLKITSVLISLVPVLWIFSKSPLYLVLIAQLVSGVAWSGFNLAYSNYILDCVSKQRRALVFSYHEMVNGIGIFVGSSIGAFLIKELKISFMNLILFIFLISAIARFLVAIVMLPKIREVKNKKKFCLRDFFRIK